MAQQPIDPIQKELMTALMLERVRPASLDEFEKVMASVLDDIIIKVAKAGDTLQMSKAREILAEVKRQLKVVYGDLPDWIRLDEDYAFELMKQTQNTILEASTAAVNAGIVGTSFSRIPTEQISALLSPKRQLGSTGFTLEDMVSDLSDYNVKRTRQILAEGVTARRTPQEVTKALQTLWGDVTRHRADAVVRTAMMDAADKAKEVIDDEFKDVIIGWMSIATLDNRTSAICISYHLQKWYKKDGWTYDKIPDKPRRHPRCRSQLIRMTSDTLEIMGEDTRAAVVWDTEKKVKHRDGSTSTKFAAKDATVKRLPADASYQKFFNTLTLNQQSSIVGGRNKAELMRKGKLSLSDVLKQQRDGQIKFMTTDEVAKLLKD